MQDALNTLMALPGMEGYVVINFDGKYRRASPATWIDWFSRSGLRINIAIELLGGRISNYCNLRAEALLEL